MKASGKRSLIFICILVVFAVGLALSFGKFFNFESSDDESSQEEQEELFDGLIFMIGEEEHVRVSREDDFTSVPQAPEKPGYNFASWYMSIDGQEERLSANDLLALDRTGKTYIYAKYEIVTYQIYYKGNVGRRIEDKVFLH